MLFQWFSFISCNFYAQNLVKNHWKTFRKPFQHLSKINSKIIEKSLKNLSKNLSKTSPKTSPKPIQKPIQNLSKTSPFPTYQNLGFCYIYIAFWSNPPASGRVKTWLPSPPLHSTSDNYRKTDTTSIAWEAPPVIRRPLRVSSVMRLRVHGF